MNVEFDGKIFNNFERNPKARSQWAEAQVKNAIEKKMGFPTFSIEDVANGRIMLEKNIQLFVDAIFKNRDMHSIDLFFVNENESKRKQREIDQRFVEEIIKSRTPYDLGKFQKEKHYHFLFEYDESGKRTGIYLVPTIFFVEVKSRLKDSRPSVISTTEAYKLNYALKEYRLPIVMAIVIIDLTEKVAEIGLKLAREFKGIGDKWIKFVPEKNKGFPKIRVGDLPEPARTPLPVLLPKGGEPVMNIQILDSKDEIEIVGEIIFADKVQIIEANSTKK